MKDAELERLGLPYPEGQSGLTAFAAALGVQVDEILALYDQIFGDLDVVALGVGWWAPHPGDARRILISDYLVQAIYATATNLVEARLHLLEAQHAMENEGKGSRYAGLKVREGILSPNILQPGCARDQLDGYMSKLHIGGLFRALGSALDCLGASIIGVLALPSEIVKADFKRARRALQKAVANDASKGGKLRQDFLSDLDEVIGSSGPDNWLEWVLGMRNTYVHRARRYQLVSVKIDAPLVGPDGNPFPVQTRRLQLPNDPERSDIEVFLDTSRDPILPEYVRTSVHGAFECTTELVRSSFVWLRNCWDQRRQDPQLLVQPRAQWPSHPRATTPFQGFGPAESPFDPGSLTANPAFLQRLRAASLDGTNRSRWAEFDS